MRFESFISESPALPSISLSTYPWLLFEMLFHYNQHTQNSSAKV